MAVIKPRSEKHSQALKPETPAKIAKIIKRIQKGVPYETAALACGMSPEHWLNIRKQGEVDISVGDMDTVHAKAVRAVKEIECDVIEMHLDRIAEAEKSHRGSEWTLERRFWKHFSPNVPAIELQKQMEELQKLLAAQEKVKGE